MKTILAKHRARLSSSYDLFLFFLAMKGFEKAVLNCLKEISATPELLKQAKVKLDALKESKTFSLTLHTDSGAKVCFFSVNDVSTFEKHTVLRKSLSEDFKNLSHARVFVDIESAAETQQALLVDAVTGLFALSDWEPPKVSNKKNVAKRKTFQLEALTSLTDSQLQKIAEQGLIIGHATNLVRTLGDMPANQLTPRIYTKEISRRAKDLSYKFRFYDRRALLKLKAGSFLAVTQGNLEDDGGIVHLTNKPKKSKKKLLLVGKGLCFDSGGYNVKTKGMYGMQKDMTGSAVALAVFESIINLNLPYEVHAFLGIAENLISHKAYKPSDVVIASDGTSIEVTDTDAEGRMVLADVLAMARKEGGDLILDFATLTGCVRRALDVRRAGVYSNRQELLPAAHESGEASGERVWGFPIGEDYREMLKSDVADIIQCRVAPEADHIYAATFLSHFVGDETPWIHMDLAPSECAGGLGLVPSQSTGFGVRWAVNFTKEFFGE